MPFLDGLTKRAVLQPMFIRRNDPVHPRAAFNQDSEQYQVDIKVEMAPQPVADTTFYNVGRDPLHNGQRMWRYTSLAIPEILSIMGWPFQIAKVPTKLTVTQPKGHWFNPLRERTNIDSPTPTSLGSLTTIQGVAAASSDPHLSKISF